jgi:DNA-directed RNA polymerase subunit L
MRTLPLLVLLLAPTLHAGDEFEKAVADFRRAGVMAGLAEKRAAMKVLLALEDPHATEVLVEEYARCVSGLREAQDKATRVEYVIQHRVRTIEGLTLRAKGDDTLDDAIRNQEERLEALRTDLAKERAQEAELSPWWEALGQATLEWFEGLDGGDRRKAEGLIWEAVGAKESLGLTLAAVELLGRVGRGGTAVDLQKLMTNVGAQRQRIERKLPKKEAAVRKMEARMQKEAEQTGGRMSQATAQQYARVKAEAATDRRAVTMLGHILDACVLSAATALAREDPETQRKSLRSLTRAMQKAKDGVRLRSLSLLASVPCEPVQAALRAALATEDEPAAIARTLTDLAHLGDRAIVDGLLSTYLDHETWVVRAAAARALARLRVKGAIPAMIARLEGSEGRWTTDLRGALRSLTGKDFRANHELWQRWWDEQGAAFEVPALEEVERAEAEASQAVGLTFFGISTTSQRVLFVLDLSGSMEFSMVPRDNPTDDPNRPYDMPRTGELSRLTVAKRDLGRAVGGLKDGALFNLVLYASDVWTWRDKLVEMDDGPRVAVQEYVESLEPAGGTNIYGALKLALELAGADGGDEWSEPRIDTIFLLTDGRPSIGVTTDPQEILDFVADRNASAGIVIHTIGLSGAQDAYLLSKLAEQNGGTYAAR